MDECAPSESHLIGARHVRVFCPPPLVQQTSTLQELDKIKKFQASSKICIHLWEHVRGLSSGCINKVAASTTLSRSCLIRFRWAFSRQKREKSPSMNVCKRYWDPQKVATFIQHTHKEQQQSVDDCNFWGFSTKKYCIWCDWDTDFRWLERDYYRFLFNIHISVCERWKNVNSVGLNRMQNSLLHREMMFWLKVTQHLHTRAWINLFNRIFGCPLSPHHQFAANEITHLDEGFERFVQIYLA